MFTYEGATPDLGPTLVVNAKTLSLGLTDQFLYMRQTAIFLVQ